MEPMVSDLWRWPLRRMRFANQNSQPSIMHPQQRSMQYMHGFNCNGVLADPHIHPNSALRMGHLFVLGCCSSRRWWRGSWHISRLFYGGCFHWGLRLLCSNCSCNCSYTRCKLHAQRVSGGHLPVSGHYKSFNNHMQLRVTMKHIALSLLSISSLFFTHVAAGEDAAIEIKQMLTTNWKAERPAGQASFIWTTQMGEQADARVSIVRYFYSNEMVRSESFSSLSPSQLVAVAENPYLIHDLHARSVIIDDGSRNIHKLYSPIVYPSQTLWEATASITANRLNNPPFYSFGKSYLGPSSDNIRTILEKTDWIRIDASETNGIVSGNLAMGPSVVKISLDRNKDWGLLTARAYMNGQLDTEILCDDYTQTPNGYWFPLRVTYRQFNSSGNGALVYREEYCALPGSVDFNMGISPYLFQPDITHGTAIDDMRFSPPKTYNYDTNIGILEP